MLELERKGCEVFCNGVKLTIVAQASKGEGKEVVKIEGLEGSNGQKWLSLSMLKEGLNVFDNLKAKSTKNYQLTQDEQNEIDMLQSRINEIIENAKARFVPTKAKKVTEMNEEELEAYIASLEALKANLQSK